MRSCRVWAWSGVVLIALLIGCQASDHVVRVTALRDPSRVGRTYWLLERSGQQGKLEAAAYRPLVERALQARGYVRVDEQTEPHLVILFDFGVGPPRQKSKSWGWAFPHKSTKTVYGRNPITGMSQTSTITTTRWTGGTSTKTWTEYTLWVRVSALDGPRYIYERSAQEVWTTLAHTSTVSSDLQRAMPVLLASAMDYFGANLPGQQVVRVPKQSPRVEWLATR